ncbi:MAG TPA: SprT-like domain-containing protein [Chitinophagaceae bacterium]|nr:SprT-like domain-containing protein [Chitinophagaceae bacterium]
MTKKESPLTALNSFLPEGSFDEVARYLHQYKVHLTITKERQTILGNYRNKISDKNHRISVNGNLNKYAFLITLLHELAHLLAHEKYGHRIQAHGRQWKEEYGRILSEFIPKKIFPADIERSLLVSLKDPSATTCAEPHLTRTLRKYDTKKEGYFFVEELPAGSLFKVNSGAVFKKGERIRKRFRCVEVATKKIYLFSPVYEVVLVS